MNDTATGAKKFGFVCIIGLPNAGKSTLVNLLVGSKVSIVSRKPQTTRSRVLGIAIQDDTQIALIDTPGIFSPKKHLDRAMVGAAWDALEGTDAVVHLIDCGTRNALEQNIQIIERLPKAEKCILVLNKTDTIPKENLLKLAQDFNDKFSYAATFMISALKAQGTDTLMKALCNRMPQGQWMYDEDQTTDMPMRLLAAEITREKLFNRLHRELPYAIFVDTEQWESFDNGSIKIHQSIYVHKDSQKAIILGKGGRQIKEIGQAARLELEAILETRVHLSLFVKVDEQWAGKPEFLSLMGF